MRYLLAAVSVAGVVCGTFKAILQPRNEFDIILEAEGPDGGAKLPITYLNWTKGGQC